MSRQVDVAGKRYTVKSLTWGDVDRLEGEGFNIMNPGLDMHKVVKTVLGKQLNPQEMQALDSVPHNDVMKVYWAIVKETNGFGEEEKNSTTEPNGPAEKPA